jgi:hypothetical protein
MFSRRYHAFRRPSLHIDDLLFLLYLYCSFVFTMVLQSRLDIFGQPVESYFSVLIDVLNDLAWVLGIL